jgi:DNA polymerase elongation subunit (family B)
LGSIDDVKSEINSIKVTDKGNEYFITKIEDVKKKVNEKEKNLLKVFVNLPPGVPHIKDQVRSSELVNSVFEYDIKYVRRYLIDKGLQPMTLVEAEVEERTEVSRVPVFAASSIEQVSDDTLTKPKILAVDIETYNPKGQRPMPEQNPIIMLALYGENFKKVLTWKKFKTDDDYVEFVANEPDLIEQFKQLVDKYEPDIITGYFSDGFDLPYINTRAKKYKIDLDLGLDHSEMQL